MKDLITGADGVSRCGWCKDHPIYVRYHDTEWGRLAVDDARQFEFIVLESAQAGLSWITILQKREAYRSAYVGFNAAKIARWGESDVQRLLANSGIVRNRKKIEASVSNAQKFLQIVERHGSFAHWLLRFFDTSPQVNSWNSLAEIPVTTPLAEKIAKELKVQGFQFFGPRITYAHLQATGFIDDHLTNCWVRNTVV